MLELYEELRHVSPKLCAEWMADLLQKPVPSILCAPVPKPRGCQQVSIPRNVHVVGLASPWC